jgi:hypothetical protein
MLLGMATALLGMAAGGLLENVLGLTGLLDALHIWMLACASCAACIINRTNYATCIAGLLAKLLAKLLLNCC